MPYFGRRILQMRTSRKLVFCTAAAAVCVGAIAPIMAQPAQSQVEGQQMRAMTAADYARAEKFMTYNVTPLVYRSGVRGNWLPDDRFWYRVTTPPATEAFLVAPVKPTKEMCDLPP